VCNEWVRGMDFESNLVVGRNIEVDCNHVNLVGRNFGVMVGKNNMSLGKFVVDKDFGSLDVY